MSKSAVLSTNRGRETINKHIHRPEHAAIHTHIFSDTIDNVFNLLAFDILLGSYEK